MEFFMSICQAKNIKQAELVTWTTKRNIKLSYENVLRLQNWFSIFKFKFQFLFYRCCGIPIIGIQSLTLSLSSTKNRPLNKWETSMSKKKKKKKRKKSEWVDQNLSQEKKLKEILFSGLWKLHYFGSKSLWNLKKDCDKLWVKKKKTW